MERILLDVQSATLWLACLKEEEWKRFHLPVIRFFLFIEVRKRMSGQARVCGPFPAQSDTSGSSDCR
jgi:hypothetical protein